MNRPRDGIGWHEGGLSGRQRTFFWFFNISFWLVLALTNLGQNPNVVSQTPALLFVFLHMMIGILLGFLLHSLLYERFQFHLFPLALLIPLVLLYSILFGVLRDFGWVLSAYVSYGRFPKRILPIVYFGNVLRFTSYFILWSLAYFAIRLYEELIQRKQEAQQARLLAQTAQLETLRYQLNPHFLFNTLSSLRALTTRNPKKAKEVVTKISEFLRYSLGGAAEDEVPLSKEIEIIGHYLDIERIQYAKKLLVEFDIDPLTEDVPIPIFLIHPLVENAVKHGMRTSSMPLRISLKTEIQNDELYVEIVNSGHWHETPETSAHVGTGTGLSNVRKRLELFYPNNHRLEVVKSADSVCVSIHLKTAPGERHAKEA